MEHQHLGDLGEDGAEEGQEPGLGPGVGLREDPADEGEWRHDQHQVDQRQSGQHLDEQQQAHDQVDQQREQAHDEAHDAVADHVPGRQADRAEGVAEGVVGVDGEAAPVVADVHGERAEGQPRQQLHGRVVGSAQVGTDDQAQPAPERDGGEHAVGHGARGAPEGVHDRLVVGELGRRLADDVARAVHEPVEQAGDVARAATEERYQRLLEDGCRPGGGVAEEAAAGARQVGRGEAAPTERGRPAGRGGCGTRRRAGRIWLGGGDGGGGGCWHAERRGGGRGGGQQAGGERTGEREPEGEAGEAVGHMPSLRSARHAGVTDPRAARTDPQSFRHDPSDAVSDGAWRGPRVAGRRSMTSCDGRHTPVLGGGFGGSADAAPKMATLHGTRWRAQKAATSKRSDSTVAVRAEPCERKSDVPAPMTTGLRAVCAAVGGLGRASPPSERHRRR